jgi:hypothetical protein
MLGVVVRSMVFFDRLVDNPRPDLEATADTLLTIWQRTLYGAA